MKNRQMYKETFNQVQLSEQKLDELLYGTKKKKLRLNKTVVAAGLVLLISFATGNMVTFAMNGTSLIETVENTYDLWTTNGVERENVVLNGNMAEIIESVRKGEIPSQEVEGSAVTIIDRYFEYSEATEDRDAEEFLKYDFEYNGGKSGFGFQSEGDYANKSIIAYVTEGRIGHVTYICELIEENGRIYLDGPEGMIDVTVDLWDGRASGEVVKKSGPLAGKKLSYTVEGNLEEYKIEIKLVIEEY